MPKANSNKKNATLSSEPLVQENPQEPVTTQEPTIPKESFRGKSKRNTITTRQTEVLKLIVEGNTNKEIAESIKTSVKTVDAHRNAIMTRLQIHDLPGLVKYALRNNLTSLD